MKQVHSFSPNFRVVCQFKDCAATYLNYESFRSHVYKKHNDVVKSNYGNSESSIVISGANLRSYASESESSESMLYEADTYDYSSEDVEEQAEELTRAAALFILRTMEVHKTSQVSHNCCSSWLGVSVLLEFNINLILI